MGSKFSLEKVGAELEHVLGLREIVTDKISVHEAWFILNACQLAVSHPQIGEPVKDRMMVLGRRMQELIRPFVGPFFCEFMEAGWHREFDQ